MLSEICRAVPKGASAARPKGQSCRAGRQGTLCCMRSSPLICSGLKRLVKWKTTSLVPFSRGALKALCSQQGFASQSHSWPVSAGHLLPLCGHASDTPSFCRTTSHSCKRGVPYLRTTRRTWTPHPTKSRPTTGENLREKQLTFVQSALAGSFLWK